MAREKKVDNTEVVVSDDDVTTTPPGEQRSLIHRILAHFPLLLRLYQIGIIVVGGGIVALGLLLVPLPGPGWVIVFAGVWVLALEFPAARRALVVLQRWFALAVAWLRRMRAKRELRRAEQLVAEADELHEP